MNDPTEKRDEELEMDALQEIIQRQREEDMRNRDDQRPLWPWTLLLCTFLLACIMLIVNDARADEYDYWLVIENKSSDPVTGFRFQPTGGSWSGNILKQPIAVGSLDSHELLTEDGECEFNFRIVWENGDQLFHPKFNVCEWLTLELTDQ